MEHTNVDADNVKLTVHWLAPAQGDATLLSTVDRALQALQGTRVCVMASDATSHAEALSAQARSILERAPQDVVIWAVPDGSRGDWQFHVASADVTSDGGNAKITEVIWPAAMVDTHATALQAVLQILTLSFGVRLGCSEAWLEWMLDILLRAEACLLELTGELARHAATVLATTVGGAWMALYQVTSQAEYLRRATDVLDGALGARSDTVTPAAREALLRVRAQVYLLQGLRDEDAKALKWAVEGFEQAAQLLPASGSEAWASLCVMQAHALESLAQLSADPADVARAVNAYRQALTVYEADHHAQRRAAVLSSLGRVLSDAGRRSRDAQALQQALCALDEAAQLYEPVQQAQVWSQVMHDQGVVLLALGQVQRDPVQFVLAWQALEKALALRSRQAQPQAWAQTRHHLASVMLQLGLENDDADKLRQATEGFQEALACRSLLTAPRDWVATQHALGRAWEALARREPGLEALERAIQAYLLALSQRRREHAPLEWAMAQLDLGRALLSAGRRVQQLAPLVAATQAFEQALSVLDDEHAAAAWTTAVLGCAAAWRAQGELTQGEAALARSGALNAQVLDVALVSVSGADRSAAAESLLAAQSRRATMLRDPSVLREAVDLVAQQLPLLDRDGALWGQRARRQLAQAWQTLMVAHGDPDAAKEAIAWAQLWLTNTAEPVGSVEWVQVQSVLATSFAWQALEHAEAASLAQAVQSLRLVLEHTSRQSHAKNWALATALLAMCEQVSATLRGVPRPEAAAAVLTQMFALLWREDAFLAGRLERVHARMGQVHG